MEAHQKGTRRQEKVKKAPTEAGRKPASILLGGFGRRNEVARNLTHEIEKQLTGFDLGSQPQPGLFKRGEVIPDLRRSRVASYLRTVTCMLTASIWVSRHHLCL
jgi:hypothetical protein